MVDDVLLEGLIGLVDAQARQIELIAPPSTGIIAPVV